LWTSIESRKAEVQHVAMAFIFQLEMVFFRLRMQNHKTVDFLNILSAENFIRISECVKQEAYLIRDNLSLVYSHWFDEDFLELLIC
jgi:hypothetical protein